MRFDFGDLHGETGEALAGLAPAALEAVVRSAIDPTLAVRTLHWGRNYLYPVSYTHLTLPTKRIV